MINLLPKVLSRETILATTWLPCGQLRATVEGESSLTQYLDLDSTQRLQGA